MRWRVRRRSAHLRDQRGASGGLGGLGGLPIKAGLPGVVVLLIALLFGGRLLNDGGINIPGVEGLPSVPGATGGSPLPGAPDPDRKLVDFVSFVLDDVQGTWQQQFQRAGRQYRPAELVLFTEAVQTACGHATSEVGPFYCPADQTVYLDLGFFRELNRRFGAPGDFAQAYVIAHEIAHHVQNVLGVSGSVRQAQEEQPDAANELSINLELQADCFAGVWGHTTYQRRILERGDLEEGLTAAAAVGDDRIQRQATGTTNPETWTHGSSEQRVSWFRRGFDSGDADSCDTFQE
ncbi:MAG TPA: neutral zinc metallopeptidase [Actinomycetota bacterium]|nr:neutral zinc metallopeptidase [Actinomycetota bacterium]